MLRSDLIFLVILSWCFATLASGQSVAFQEAANTPFTPAAGGSVVFADIDGDADQDVVIAGNATPSPTCKAYRNDGLGNFSLIPNTPFPGLQFPRLAFFDMDGDGDQDLLQTGSVSANNHIAKLFANDGTGGFTEVTGTPFVGVVGGKIGIADVDGDGDPDVVIMGASNVMLTTNLYLNDGTGSFLLASGTNFMKPIDGDLAFGDVDGDGDQDLFICGYRLPDPKNRLYVNDGSGLFTEVPGSMFISLSNPSCAFADLDLDGDLDLVAQGMNLSGTRVMLVYENLGALAFADVSGPPLAGVNNGSLTVADLNGDSLPEILSTGRDLSDQPKTNLYVNNGAMTFTEAVNMPFIDVEFSATAATDVDQDTDLDLLITGQNVAQFAKLYVNCDSSIQWYADVDADGLGDPQTDSVACVQPFGYVANDLDCDDSVSAIGLPTVWYLDADGDGFGDPFQDSVACIQPTGHVADSTDCDDGDDLVFPGAPCVDGVATTFNDHIGPNCVCAGEFGKVQIKVFLEGPYDPISGLMQDHLRVQGLIPLSEPFTAMGYPFDQHGLSGGPLAANGSSIDPVVLTVSGPDAIVDWVVVELRDRLDPVEVNGGILYSRVALLQRDGDVVDLDGFSSVEFNAGADAYSVALLGRSHLPVMTKLFDQYPFGATPLMVDFTTSGTEILAPAAWNDLNGTMVLATGDATNDQILKYAGSGNDREPILQVIGGSVPTATIQGYVLSDHTMDGTVKYAGTNNDRQPILQNIGGAVPTAVRDARLP